MILAVLKVSQFEIKKLIAGVSRAVSIIQNTALQHFQHSFRISFMIKN